MFTTAFRPLDLLDRFSTPWTVRETAALKLPAENPSNPAVKPLTFNLLAPLFNAARAIQINQYEGQKESGYEWLFNYKAVLNTRVSTITTKLANALTSDLEAIFGRWPGGVRNIRRDPSGIYVFEPAPTADEWAWLYGSNINAADPSSSPPTVVTTPNWEQRPSAGQTPGPGVTPNGGPAQPSSSIVLKNTSRTLNTTGTVVILSGGTLQGTASGTVRFEDGTGTVTAARTWATYLDLFKNIEFTDCWRYGLLDRAVIAATAATGNGSQLQSSITLRNPDILKMQYSANGTITLTDGTTRSVSAGTTYKPGDSYVGQQNFVVASPVTLPGGGSSSNSTSAYDNNYAGGVRGNDTDAHGFIQTKFTAFWHS